MTPWLLNQGPTSPPYERHQQRDARQRAHKAQAEVLNPSNEFLYSDVAQREIAAIYRCDLTLVISDAEVALLQQRFRVPASLLLHCPFMYQPSTAQQWPSYANKQHFIFIGNYFHCSLVYL